MAMQTLEGTWEEIAAHADELADKHLKVIYEVDAPADIMDIPVVGPPNEGMLAVLKEIEERQKGRRHTFGDSVADVRYARSGPVYGMEPCDDYDVEPADD